VQDARQRWEMLRKFCLENLKARVHLEEMGIYYRLMLKWVFNKYVVNFYTGSILLRIGTSGKLF
jgi:hypothetical protein